MRSPKSYKNAFKKMDKFWHGAVFVCFVLSVLLSCVTCADEYYIGKSREELAKEMFKVDSLIKAIQLQLDSTSIDFNGFYIQGQRINNGH